MVVLPLAGPPVTIPLGYLLPGGQVSLDQGVQVEGSYWENMDRKLFNNGTIIYKGTNVVENGKVLFGTVDDSGNIKILSNIGNSTMDINLLRSLDINNQWNNL